jgi:hypothetical protein
MKAALCFIISYNHVLNKEEIWKRWIEPNKDIINVYFYYKEFSKIKSPWIKNHAIPQSKIVPTSYYHVVPAYMRSMSHALQIDASNKWFCFLTDSCVPIISPEKFRRLFEENNQFTIMSWKKAWWNIIFHKRANLRFFSEEYHIGHAPWFILTKQDAILCLEFIRTRYKKYKQICKGGLANESVFAIILRYYKRLRYVKNSNTHLTDWSRMMSPTSPYLFKEATCKNIEFIQEGLRENPYAMFLRKMDSSFPNSKIHEFVF